jgi:hypothetical protein
MQKLYGVIPFVIPFFSWSRKLLKTVAMPFGSKLSPRKQQVALKLATASKPFQVGR